MTKFAEYLIAGASLGVVYALIALGFVVIFKATGALNFAHGSLLFIGAYTVGTLHDDIGFVPAVAVAGLMVGVVAFAIERWMCRRLSGPEAHVPLAIMTIGIDIVLVTEMTRRLGTRILGMGDPWGNHVMQVGGLHVPQSRLAALVAAGIILTIFFFALQRTNWGLAMRASAADPHTAALMGIRPHRVASSAWVLAGLFAVVAAIFLTTYPTPGLTVDIGAQALAAFPAAVLGGMDSPFGALVGGVSIGVATMMVQGYAGDVAWLGQGFYQLVPYLILLMVLLWRPNGLFGSKELRRV